VSRWRPALEGAEAPGPAPYEKYTGIRSWKYLDPRDAARLLQPYVDLGVTHFVIVFPFGSEEVAPQL